MISSLATLIIIIVLKHFSNFFVVFPRVISEKNEKKPIEYIDE